VAVFLTLSMLTEPVVSCFFANTLDPVVPRAVPALVTTFAGLCARPPCPCRLHHVVSSLDAHICMLPGQQGCHGRCCCNIFRRCFTVMCRHDNSIMSYHMGQP